jgi:hypothetical protein
MTVVGKPGVYKGASRYAGRRRVGVPTPTTARRLAGIEQSHELRTGPRSRRPRRRSLATPPLNGRDRRDNSGPTDPFHRVEYVQFFKSVAGFPTTDDGYPLQRLSRPVTPRPIPSPSPPAGRSSSEWSPIPTSPVRSRGTSPMSFQRSCLHTSAATWTGRSTSSTTRSRPPCDTNGSSTRLGSGPKAENGTSRRAGVLPPPVRHQLRRGRAGHPATSHGRDARPPGRLDRVPPRRAHGERLGHRRRSRRIRAGGQRDRPPPAYSTRTQERRRRLQRDG